MQNGNRDIEQKSINRVLGSVILDQWTQTCERMILLYVKMTSSENNLLYLALGNFFIYGVTGFKSVYMEVISVCRSGFICQFSAILVNIFGRNFFMSLEPVIEYLLYTSLKKQIKWPYSAVWCQVLAPRIPMWKHLHKKIDKTIPYPLLLFLYVCLRTNAAQIPTYILIDR